MNRDRIIQIAAAGGVIAACAAMAAWMMPNTTPNRLHSPIAALAAVAEAEKPTYSPVPDRLIPASQPDPLPVAPLRQPASAPAAGGDQNVISADGSDSAPPPDPTQVATTETPDEGAPVPVAPPASPPPTEPARVVQAPVSRYAEARAAWRASLSGYLGDPGPAEPLPPR